MSEHLSMASEPYVARRFFQVFPVPSVSRQNAYEFFWARSGIYHALKLLKTNPRSHVLLPAYLCTAAVEPFVELGFDVEFYDVGRDCRLALAEIESKTRSETVLIFAVHYFGFPTQIHELRKMCTEKRIFLFEDCAHVLAGSVDGQELGSFGDISVFSWRKFLPLYDGAELRMNSGQALSIEWQNEKAIVTAKILKSLVDRYLAQSSSVFSTMAAKTLSWCRDRWRSFLQVHRDAPVVPLDSNQASFDLSLVNHRISRPSRWLKRHCDVDAVVSARRANYLYLRDRLTRISGITSLHESLPDHVCPWIYPLFFDCCANAHVELRKLGVPAVTWGGVRPSSFDAHRFPNSEYLYENLVFLPIHQNLTRSSLDNVIDAVARIAESHSSRKLQCCSAVQSKLA